MPLLNAPGVQLYYETSGSGRPLVFCHEYATDLRAWEPQVRHFGQRYRVIVYNNRGYPPSSVPNDDSAWTHQHLIDDLKHLLDGLGIERAHIAGLATGGNVALNFALAHPQRVHGLVVAGAGAGTSDRENWLAGARNMAADIRARGSQAAVDAIANAPQRVIFKQKDPIGWNKFVSMIAELDPKGAEKMMGITLVDRLPITALVDKLRTLALPILVMMGDQDFPAHEAGRLIRDSAPHAGLAMLPMCGHTLNFEEPMLFNLLVSDFLAAVDAGRWGNWRAEELKR